MILQSIPTEDFEEFDNELTPRDSSPQSDAATDGTTLYGHSSGVVPKKKNSAKRKIKKAANVIKESTEGNYRFTLLGICCCMGVVATGASLALLSRYAEENTVDTPLDFVPMLAIFSYAIAGTTTNNALAGLAAALLNNDELNRTETSDIKFKPVGQVSGPFIPDGNIVKIWQPKKMSEDLQAFAHGEVSRKLRRIHNFEPPQLLDLTLPVGSGLPGQTSNAATLEVDAFLEMRRYFEGKGSGENGGSREIVLISHPHHLPYLMALAWHSGFKAYILDPAVYATFPWDEFGCNTFGYPPDMLPNAGVEHEMNVFRHYVDMLREGDSQQYTLLQPVIRAANATLNFYRCTADRGRQC